MSAQIYSRGMQRSEGIAYMPSAFYLFIFDIFIQVHSADKTRGPRTERFSTNACTVTPPNTLLFCKVSVSVFKLLCYCVDGVLCPGCCLGEAAINVTMGFDSTCYKNMS